MTRDIKHWLNIQISKLNKRYYENGWCRMSRADHYILAADDCDAPHEMTITIHSFTDPEALVRETATGYILARYDHYWICVLNDIKIAEIKTTGIQPLVGEVTYDETNRIHFVYKATNY